ncbi:polysaccharide biosynthesis/export family protein [Tunturiibacter lichenicola]|uniref:polysaccharide biosynthesis/export family protein n=1 Tax=Tunturiibacter lichenicola TaxID=2051959 RepID=UPI0021B260BA|nr:SLBB domain-containing protein [Edaphobacter lichenicola]
MTAKGWFRALRVLVLTCIACSIPLTTHGQSAQPNDNPFASLGPTQSTATQNPQSQSSGSDSTNQQLPQLPQTPQEGTTINGVPNLGNTSSDSSTERNGRRVGQNAYAYEPPVPLTPYQRLVASSVGKVLPIYGSTLFSNVPTTFAPVDRIPVTPEYLIGPGDELLVRLWGQVTLDGHFTVDRSGNVYLPQVGAIRVAGIPFAKLTDYLRAQIGRTFRNFDINVNIGQLRSIQIFIVGEAKRPGSYTVSSLSTLVNALFASGGPGPMGSMRDIQVKRNGEAVVTFDFYDLLLKGDKSKDVQLVSGDVIYIPPVGPMVAVAGSVDVPALYELKKESTVSELLRLSGGLSTLAQDKQIRIERLKLNDSRSVVDVKLDAAGLATELHDGDIVEVSPIIDRFKDSVTLRGNVAEPRRFAWFPGMRVRDIIPDKEALLTRDYWLQRNRLGLPILDSTPAVRLYAPDAPTAQYNGGGISPVSPIVLPSLTYSQRLAAAQDSDTNVYGITPKQPLGRSDNSTPPSTSAGDDLNSTQADAQSSLPSGDNGNTVRNTNNSRGGALGTGDTRNETDSSSATGSSVSAAVTGTSQRFPAKNAVVLSAPEVDWAYAVIQRLNHNDLSSQLIPFNLGKVVLDGSATDNLELEAGDVVTIFSKSDIRVPQSQQTKYVRLEGEFSASGTYSVAPGETLRQLVTRAGGLTSGAYLYGSQFTRESARVIQQQRLNDYAADLDRRIKLAEANAANNAISPQDDVQDVAALQNARTVAQRLRQLKSTGRIVLDMGAESKTVADIPDLPLEDGDVFIVPQMPLTVDVFGAVYNQTSFLYNPQKRVGDYLHQAGGGTRTADNSRSYIVRADGAIVSRQYSSGILGRFDSTRLNPGDAVVVPEQVDKRPLLRNLVDIATIFGQFGLGIAAINVLR